MHRITFFILLFLSTFTTKANSVFVPENELKTATSYIHYLVDSTNQLTINQIITKPDSVFKPSLKDHIDFGYTEHPIWLYLEIDNKGIAPFLLFDNNAIDSITMYMEDKLNNKYFIQHHGEQILKENKNFYTIIPVFRLPYSPGKHRVWLKIKNYNKITSFYLEIGSAAKVFRKIQTKSIILSGFFFLMAIVLLSNIILYITYRTELILSFGLFNLATLLFICTVSGLNVFFPGNYDYYISQYSSVLLSLLILSGIYMSVKLLNIRTYYRRFFIYLMIVGFICIVVILMNLLGMIKEASMISGPLGGFVIPVYIILSWKEYKRGESHAIYYFMGWVFYYILMVSIILYIAKVIPPGEYMSYLTPCVSMVDFFFFSATIIFKINAYRKEKNDAEREKINLIEKQNIILEKKVDARTKELQELYDEIATQNEELFSQKEQISELNDNLEKIVAQRTTELQDTMVSLQQRNQDLEQFSYVVSHNLRGPVATILGLTNLFNRKKLDDPINSEVILNIDRVVSNLDNIIRDLNYIISLKEPINQEQKNVNLRSLTTLCLDLLETEIQDSSIHITADFSEIENINSVPAYLQNIFYNLISNSIKYRKENLPKINIKSYLKDNHIILSFTDNGIGIDMENITSGKIFRLYQRFNQHTEGKGIGLFLVKSQVEALKGTIEVKSKLREGTEFIITLPINKES